MPSRSTIRSPAVAGWFYPGSKAELTRTVDELLAHDLDPAPRAPVRMLLVPHAGYTYSGRIAAHGFRRLRAGTSLPARAFVIGPSHVERFDYTSVYGGDAYRTPLGDVPVDRDAARSLSEIDPSIRASGSGHDLPRHERGEHAIEVEIPFLQRCVPGVRIVPLVMGSASWSACEALGGAIARIADWRCDVVIASSDLSHFHDDTTAHRMDGLFCDTLLGLDARELHARVARGECEACGAGPVVAALLATAALRARNAEVLARATSARVNRDLASVVGYASAAVTGEP